MTVLTLSNGLRVLLVRDVHAQEVQVTMRYGVGAVDDGEMPGIAHLAEHTMFQQTLGGQSLFSQLEDIATYFNAETTFEATTYTSRAPSRWLDRLLSIEAVRLGMRCTSVTDSAFEREREVVINEARQRDEARQYVDAIHQAVYADTHPYRHTAASVDAIAKLKRDDVCRFVDAHYAPGNAVLVVSGDLTAEELATSLSKFLARVAKRPFAPSLKVSAGGMIAGSAEATAPVDDDRLLVAWPLPQDPQLQAQLMAVVSVLYPLVANKVQGEVTLSRIGDVHAPAIALIIEPSTYETLASVRKAVAEAITSLPSVFERTDVRAIDALVFDRIQQSAIYNTYASLEDGGARDVHLAEYMLDGRDPRLVLSSQFAAMRDLNRETAIQLAQTYFAKSSARLITLKAASEKKRGHDVALASTHDLGQRRAAPDPAEAHHESDYALPRVQGVVSRVLPNGLRVVLVPLTNVPTVDMRLVFRAGSADEPADKNGVAELSARALDWNLAYLPDLIEFMAAGGGKDLSVDVDHTTFAVRGVDMHLDLLLTGLRRWVRDGTYSHALDISLGGDETSKARSMRTAWRQTIFGPGHPYTRSTEAVAQLTREDLTRFRKRHYTPDNATLIITGRFDRDLASQWVDYLFTDWQGHAVPRDSPQTKLTTASLVVDDDLAQINVRFAFPATTKSRAQQLVTAQLLADVVEDVRHQLGATYGMSAQLFESRLDSHYEVGGWVDAARATDAIHLVAERLEQLRSDPQAAARAFIISRQRVLVHLAALTASAEQLGDRIEHDVELGRSPLSDLETAAEVRALTVDNMTGAMGDLDLTHAAISARGPLEQVRTMYAAIARTPILVEAAPRVPPTKIRFGREDDEIDETDLNGERRKGFTFALTPAYVFGHIVDNQPMGIETKCCGGFGARAMLGWHVQPTTTIGLNLSIASLSGIRTVTRSGAESAISVTPIDIAPVVQFERFKRVSGGLYLGLHLDTVTATDPVTMTDRSTTSGSLGIGLVFDVDVAQFGKHRLALGLQAEGALAADTGYGGVRFGLTYRQ